MSAKAAKSKAVTAPYERTQEEKAAITKLRERRGRRKPSPGMTITKKDGTNVIDFAHPDKPTATALSMEAVGTTSADFLHGLLRQLIQAGVTGNDPDELKINFMLAAISGIEPQDEVEAMLAAQMAAVHMAAMTFAARLTKVETIPQQDSAERAFNKLTRTFTAQMEALKRYRTGGQQKVTVEHVTVQAGGQAIVGNVSHPGGGSSRENEGSTP